MKIDLINLLNKIVNKIEITETYNVEEDIIKKAGLLGLEPLYINGNISLDGEFLHLNLKIKGKMILPCAITLVPVNYPFSIEINEIIDENYQKLSENVKIEQNSIDILPIIWENIVMEIPMKVVSEEARNINLKGDGWQLLTDSKERGVNNEN